MAGQLRYEVCQDSGGLWNAWRVAGPGQRYVSTDRPTSRANAIEWARRQLAQGGGGVLAVYDAHGELEYEEPVEGTEDA